MKRCSFVCFIVAVSAIIAILGSCSESKSPAGELPVIDLVSGLINPEIINLSEFIEGVSYIPLETSPDALLTGRGQVFLTEKFIFVVENNGCYQFERETGRFVREIGKQGRGPQEYGKFQFLSEDEASLYFTSYNNKLLRFSFDGVCLAEIPAPEYDRATGLPYAFARFSDTLFVAYYHNGMGSESNLLIIFDEHGESVKVYPNEKLFEWKGSISIFQNMGSFHKHLDNLCFNVWYNDTTFIVGTDSLIPSLVINRGESAPPYDYLGWDAAKREANKGKEFIQKVTFIETERWIILFFGSTRIALYDKEAEALKVSIPDTGMVNDLNLPLMPVQYTAISKREELAYMIQSVSVVKGLTDSKDGSGIPPELERLKGLSPDANPVVSILKIRR